LKKIKIRRILMKKILAAAVILLVFGLTAFAEEGCL
jgi:hypothetical protein